MIEELLVKNAQISDENTQAQQMRGPFSAEDSMMNDMGGHPNTFGMPAYGRDPTAHGSYQENSKLT